MGKKLKTGLCVGILAVTLTLGFASIGLADGMSGMDMGGTTVPSQQQNNSMPGMDMTNGQNANNQMPGMDSNNNMANMPGMEADGGKTSEGVNWYVVGGFLVINFLVIGSAGVLKFTKMVPKRI